MVKLSKRVRDWYCMCISYVIDGRVIVPEAYGRRVCAGFAQLGLSHSLFTSVIYLILEN